MIRALAVLAALLFFAAAPLAAQTLPLQSPAAESDAATAEDTGGAEAAASARSLAEILRDPASRQALIDRLLEIAGDREAPGAAAGAEAATGASAAAGATESSEQTAAEGAPTLARQLAEYTQSIAESVSDSASELARTVAALGALAEDDNQVDWNVIRDAAIALGSVILVVLVGLWILRLIGARIFAAMERNATGYGLLRRILLVFASSVIDAILVVAAWGGGYAFALLTGDPGEMGIRQGLFLNAFLVIELTKVVLRFVLAPNYGALRLWPMSDTTAGYWHFWISRLIGLLGYGLMFFVPVTNIHISYRVGHIFELLVVLTALIMGITMVLQNRESIRRGFEARAEANRGEFVSQLLLLIGRFWHILAIIYLVAAFVVWVGRPADAMAFMVQATLQSALAIGIGSLITLFIGRAITGGMRLPAGVREKLPLLERRLNTFVPTILRVVRLVVLVGVVLAICQAWELIDVAAWLESPFGREAIGRVLTASLVVLGAIAIWIALSAWIEHRLTPSERRAPTSREKTLLALFRNAIAIALTVLTIMLALAELGVNVGPLLAGAGVVGLAIGFGAQKLVQDIINGAFIQFENAMNEGDVVTAGGTTGVVEKLTIRSVGLRDLSGVYHLIPFSSVDQVSNFMRGFAYHVAEIGVAYRENIAEVKQLLQVAFDRLKETDHGANIIGDLEMHGVTSLGDSAVVVRCRIKTLPGSQWATGRAFNEIVKEVLDAAGVEIPFPHLTVYMGQEKDGGAPPLRVINQDGGKAPLPEQAAKDASEDAKTPEEAGEAASKPEVVIPEEERGKAQPAESDKT